MPSGPRAVSSLPAAPENRPRAPRLLLGSTALRGTQGPRTVQRDRRARFFPDLSAREAQCSQLSDAPRLDAICTATADMAHLRRCSTKTPRHYSDDWEIVKPRLHSIATRDMQGVPCSLPQTQVRDASPGLLIVVQRWFPVAYRAFPLKIADGLGHVRRPIPLALQNVVRLDTTTLIPPLGHTNFPPKIPKFAGAFGPVVCVGYEFQQISRNRLPVADAEQLGDPLMNAPMPHHFPHHRTILRGKMRFLAPVAFFTNSPKIFRIICPAPILRNLVVHNEHDAMIFHRPATHPASPTGPAKHLRSHFPTDRGIRQRLRAVCDEKIPLLVAVAHCADFVPSFQIAAAAIQLLLFRSGEAKPLPDLSQCEALWSDGAQKISDLTVNVARLAHCYRGRDGPGSVVMAEWVAI
ncbi:hypothetical protein PUN4_780039 [Paraburkholderia unamae]|nr:hypothetical protein PUN4_780039 [Paraburkholderia unamae]